MCFSFCYFSTFVFRAQSGTTNNQRTGSSDVSYPNTLSRDSKDIGVLSKKTQCWEKPVWNFWFFVWIRANEQLTLDYSCLIKPWEFSFTQEKLVFGVLNAIWGIKKLVNFYSAFIVNFSEKSVFQFACFNMTIECTRVVVTILYWTKFFFVFSKACVRNFLCYLHSSWLSVFWFGN